jgi:hypothetical protein
MASTSGWMLAKKSSVARCGFHPRARARAETQRQLLPKYSL